MSEWDARERIRKIDNLREKAKKCRELSEGYLGSTDVLTIDHTWTVSRRFRPGLARQTVLDITGPAKDALRDWLSEKAREWEREADRLAKTLSVGEAAETSQSMLTGQRNAEEGTA